MTDGMPIALLPAFVVEQIRVPVHRRLGAPPDAISRVDAAGARKAKHGLLHLFGGRREKNKGKGAVLRDGSAYAEKIQRYVAPADNGEVPAWLGSFLDRLMDELVRCMESQGKERGRAIEGLC